MPQFAVLIWEKEIAFEDIPPEIMEGHETLGEKVEEAGGQIVAGYAAEPASSGARTLRGGEVTKGQFNDSPQQIAGFFILEARDLDHAMEMVKHVPILDGGVEVRSLLEEE